MLEATGLLHMGHGSPPWNGCAHGWQQHKCQHGWNMTAALAAQQITHSWSSSSSSSLLAQPAPPAWLCSGIWLWLAGLLLVLGVRWSAKTETGLSATAAVLMLISKLSAVQPSGDGSDLMAAGAF